MSAKAVSTLLLGSCAALTALIVWDMKVHQHIQCPMCGRAFNYNNEQDRAKLSEHWTNEHGVPAEQQGFFA